MADGVSRQAVLLGSTEMVASLDYLERFMERLTAVTPEAMQQLAGALFSDRNRTVGWYLPHDGQTARAADA
jgi:predicted Zn-dependent peptidase